jgi:egghead protein (zeste-white 4 protein)
MHVHGSNLLVRSDIEDSIGWNFGPTLAEDEIFGE